MLKYKLKLFTCIHKSQVLTFFRNNETTEHFRTLLTTSWDLQISLCLI